MFADEPTGNLDSTTSAEILELLRESVTDFGQTTVMVTHDAHAAAIADRVLFLADGLIVKDIGPSTAHQILEAMEEVSAIMRRVALKGLLGRKLRTALTMLAIVIGVSMISGTFVLTDTIDRAFTSVVRRLVRQHRRRRERQEARRLVGERQRHGPRLAATKVRALPDVQEAAGTILDLAAISNTARMLDRDGKVIGTSGSGFGVNADAERFNPFELTEGRWAAGPERGRDRLRDCLREGLRGRATPSASQATGRSAPSRSSASPSSAT